MTKTWYTDPTATHWQPTQTLRAVPEIILRWGWAAGTFLSCGGGGGCFVDNVSKGWGITCPGGQGLFDP